MGSFGVGNFDNDDALDVRHDLVEQIVASIQNELEGEDFCVSDCDRVMANVVVLNAVLQHTQCSKTTSADCELLSFLKGIGSGCGLSKGAIRGWTQQVLSVFDAEIDELQPSPGYKAARRKAMEDAFAVLESFGNSEDT